MSFCFHMVAFARVSLKARLICHFIYFLKQKLPFPIPASSPKYHVIHSFKRRGGQDYLLAPMVLHKAIMVELVYFYPLVLLLCGTRTLNLGFVYTCGKYQSSVHHRNIPTTNIYRHDLYNLNCSLNLQCIQFRFNILARFQKPYDLWVQS